MQIAQVLMNLIVNAAHAAGEGGRIQVSSHDSGEVVHIAVEDHGCGIPERELAQIFDPFFTTKPVGEGTGLGLAICYRIIEGLSGVIDFRSRAGKGTTFVVKLPLASVEKEAES